MKKERGKRVVHIAVFIIFAALLLISIVSADFSEFLKKIKKTITGEEIKQVTVNITVGLPQIITVYNDSMTSVAGGTNQGPFATSVVINFTAYHVAGVGMLNHSTARINFTKANEDLRQNITCASVSSKTTGVYINYSCNVTMWWWDASGTWNIAAYVMDNNSNAATNATATFQVGPTTGFEIGPTTLTWAAIGAGDINKTSNNDPLLFNNTGNQNISINTIQINATNLRGEADNTLALWAGNFSVSIFTGGAFPNELECNGSAIAMSASAYTNITGASLIKGNYSTNTGTTGQEQLYICLKRAGTELITQSYSTANESTWTVLI